jgi:hypothetical protein
MKSYKVFSVLAIASLIIFSVSSCKKKEGCTDSAASNYDSSAEKDNGTCTYCVAGTGGGVTIVGYLKHHTMLIPNTATHLDTVYLKFNTSNNPGADLSLYDTYFVGEAGEDHVHLEGLKCGKYYIYGVGYDDMISQRVVGGIPYTLTDTSGEVDLNIPVTE